ncbi:MAG: hypothetical protein IJN41_05000, partial [Firmicutes bacterium]|nr:hypothetical protein [Bacillota bacterium]
ERKLRTAGTRCETNGIPREICHERNHSGKWKDTGKSDGNCISSKQTDHVFWNTNFLGDPKNRSGKTGRIYWKIPVDGLICTSLF